MDFNSFKDTTVLYTPWNSTFMPHNPRLSDLFFFSNSKNIDKYLGGLYDHILPHLKIPNAPIDAHTDSYVFAKKCNLEVVMIRDYCFDEATNMSIARNHYDNCEYRGDKFPGIENIK